MVEVISSNLEFPGCTINDRIQSPMEDIYVDDKVHTITAIAKYVDNRSPEYNHDVLFIAKNFEELMQIIFKTKDSQSYSSGNTILNEADQAAYAKYFYEDEEGKGRYAAAGGNMC
jgi:hypothetical protein